MLHAGLSRRVQVFCPVREAVGEEQVIAKEALKKALLQWRRDNGPMPGRNLVPPKAAHGHLPVRAERLRQRHGAALLRLGGLAAGW
jgi:hypothetical protein